MKNNLKFLIILYFVLVIIKILIASSTPMSTAFSDDYQYLKMARSFFFDQNFNIHGIDFNYFPPLYPILISITHFFNDSLNIYFFIKVINALLSSLIIIPVYFLAKEFLSEKYSKILTLIIALLPSNFTYTSYILTENLFYSLFMFSIYFIYKVLVYGKNLNIILAGLFTGLTLLTRIHGIVILALLSILFLLDLLKKKINYKLIIIALIAFIIFLPWFVNNLLNEQYAIEATNIISRGSIFNSIYPLIVWLITYAGGLILSSLIIFPLFMVYNNKNINFKLKKFSLLVYISIIATLLIAVNHHLRSEKYFYKLNDFIFFSGKLIGRYIDFVIPLIMILGFIYLIDYKKNLNKKGKKILNISIILTIITLIASLHFLSRSLFLPNNPSLTWIGGLKQVIDYLFYSRNLFNVINDVNPGITLASYIIIPLLLILIVFLITKYLIRLNLSKIFILIVLFLISINLINGAITYYNANSWYETPQVQLSLWLNDYDKDKISDIMLDERYSGGLKKNNQTMLYIRTEDSVYTILGYWLNDNIVIGNVNNFNNVNYIISRDENLNFELIKESNNGIYVYKVR